MSDKTLPAAQDTPGVAEVKPTGTPRAAPRNDQGGDPKADNAAPGIVRFHPVHGQVTFADANEYAANGGDDGDFRFKTGGEADAARTFAEAAIVVQQNLNAKLDAHQAKGIVRNSVQAQQSLDGGASEPDMPKAV